jgi:RimJ/RimL family protein N-acetyltransferase
LLWQWDNDIAVREASFNSDPVAWDDYNAWFKERLDDKAFTILVAYDREEKPVGRAYLEIPGDRGVIHVAVAPEERGKGHSPGLVRAATEYAFTAFPIDSLVGYIKGMNTASIRTFQACGYHQAGAAVIEDQDAMVYEIRRGNQK